MKINLVIVFGILAFISQIVFSFYYSSHIVSLNSEYNRNQQLQSQLILDQQQLQSTLSRFTNSDYILENLPDLKPINQQLP